MSDMNLAAADKQAPQCGVCRRVKMQVSDGSSTSWQCVNCGSDAPKTGHTIIYGENDKFSIVRPDGLAVAPPSKPSAPAASASAAEQPGTISVRVPVSIFPDLVIWARKMKVPKDWTQAEKISAITTFQVEINKKLGDLAQ